MTIPQRDRRAYLMSLPINLRVELQYRLDSALPRRFGR